MCIFALSFLTPVLLHLPSLTLPLLTPFPLSTTLPHSLPLFISSLWSAPLSISLSPLLSLSLSLSPSVCLARSRSSPGSLVVLSTRITESWCFLILLCHLLKRLVFHRTRALFTNFSLTSLNWKAKKSEELPRSRSGIDCCVYVFVNTRWSPLLKKSTQLVAGE